ncbi:MAG: DNA primase [Bacteroidales bacterium]|nr:DNA primase [Bacteroidales bacterium]
MIPAETVRQIEDAVRIEEVVGDFVTLRRRGASFVACCPFHNEKTPSFYVTPSKGIYKCFGCGKAGSAVGFVMEHEHCSYAEALRYLANKYHIEIREEELSAEEIARRGRVESLMLVTEFALKFFVDQLKTPEGSAVGLAYLHSRGLEDATIAKFSLGWAPSGKDRLTAAALAAGYKLEYLVAAGLTVQHEDGTLTDRFRERVMFPIHSVSGRVIAFSGRTLKSDNPAKYVNSPETEIYTKSRSLLGISYAKSEIARREKCILVEGNVDVITLQQLGIPNVVASCGTSLTVEQIRLIHKFTENLTIMYDGDKAGIHAAIRGINMVLSEGLNVKVVLLPEGEDPDSFGRSHTLQEFNDFLAANEQDFIAFKTELLLSDAAGDPLKKANLINDIADTIAAIPDPVKRQVYSQTCSAKFGIDANILFSRVEKTSHAAAAAPAETPRRTPETPADEPVLENRILAPIEEELLDFILQFGREILEFPTDSPYFEPEGQEYTVAEFIRASLGSGVFANRRYASVFDAYFAAYDEGLPQDGIIRTLLDSEDADVREVAASHSMEKYQLTYTPFSASLTATGSWLVMYVPRAILKYNDKVLQTKIEDLKKQLPEAGEDEQTEILSKIMSLQKIQKKIKKQLE